jgi:RimJ/RimL family protein N-acetyltransferase
MQHNVVKISPLIFSPSYREDVQVTSDLRARFRLIRPADKAKLAAGFERLSTESRYRRFFAQKKALSPAELQFYANPDGVDHVAIGALALNRDGEEGEGLGVGRFVRMPNEPEVAEIALTVVDAWQGRGLGRLLLQRLLMAAAERGIRRIRCHLLADNARMHQLIQHLAAGAAFTYDGEMMTCEFPIPEAIDAHPLERHTDAAAPLFNLLRLIAEGSVAPIALGLNGMREGMRWMAPFYVGSQERARLRSSSDDKGAR